jgi:DnaJ-class molecular chaperone
MKVWLGLAAAVWVAGYLVACRIWPYTDCRKCKGGGRFRSPSGKAWRLCRRCKGSGTRIRTGRKIWDKLIKVGNDAA